MKDTAKKVLKTGYGLGLLSLAEAKKVANKVKSELQLNEEESVKLAKHLVKNSRKASEDVFKTVGKHFETAVLKSGVAKKSELKVVKNLLKRRVKSVIKAKKKAAKKKSKSRKSSAKKGRKK